MKRLINKLKQIFINNLQTIKIVLTGCVIFKLLIIIVLLFISLTVHVSMYGTVQGWEGLMIMLNL